MTRYSSAELPHIWAHQRAEKGTSPSALSFRGKSIYSYHAEIGRIIERNGRQAYLLNEAGYSMTTSKHQNQVKAAIPGNATVFHYDGPTNLGSVSGKELFRCAIEAAAYAGERAEKARTSKNREQYLAMQGGLLERAQEIADFFGLKNKVDEKAVARLREAMKREAARAAKAKKEQQAKLEAQNAKELKKWLAGTSNNFPYMISRVYLRAVGDQMETSRGVFVSLKDAKRALKFVRKVRSRKAEWRRNGDSYRVGGYELDAINTQGVVAGCHHITWDEIDRFAAAMGW